MNAETSQNETKKTDDPNVQTEDSSDKTEVKSEDKKASEKSVAETVQPNSAAVNNLRVLENIEVKLTVEVGNTEIKIKDLLLSLVITDKDFLKTPGLPLGLYSANTYPSFPGFISFLDQSGVVQPHDGLTERIFKAF